MTDTCSPVGSSLTWAVVHIHKHIPKPKYATHTHHLICKHSSGHWRHHSSHHTERGKEVAPSGNNPQDLDLLSPGSRLEFLDPSGPGYLQIHGQNWATGSGACATSLPPGSFATPLAASRLRAHHTTRRAATFHPQRACGMAAPPPPHPHTPSHLPGCSGLLPTSSTTGVHFPGRLFLLLNKHPRSTRLDATSPYKLWANTHTFRPGIGHLLTSLSTMH